MRKFLQAAAVIVFIGLSMFLFSRLYVKNDLKMNDKSIKVNILYKGLKGARAFTTDPEGNTYIAFKDRVQMINKLGKSFVLFTQKDLNINSIIYKDNRLYYTSDCKFASYDLIKKNHETILGNLPNLGDYGESKLLLQEDNIFITIGAATNSGIVGEDNAWLADNPFNHDFSPKAITISGKNSTNAKTGAFTPYNTKNVAGQIMPAHTPGNGSVTVYNIKNGDNWLYAWGIRNINGIDYSSEGKIFCTVGGMEDRGARPVKGDVDYIFQLKENIWYGWPDYSGGDPVNSPRFKGGSGERIQFLLGKHPTSNPPAPIYQHKTVSALGCLTVDREGIIGEKDSIYFYDLKDNMIYEINKGGILKEKIKLSENSSVSSLKADKEKMLILDSKGGVILSVTGKPDEGRNLSKSVIYCLLGIIVVLTASILWKIKK